MIPNQQMNTNYTNQYIIDSQTNAQNTSPYQNQTFNYPTKPAQYVQPRFMPPPSPGPGPGPGSGPQMIPMQAAYQQRPTPSSTPVSLPLQQSPTSPSVPNYYQYPQYPNQYQNVQYHQPQIIPQNNFMQPHQMFQDQVRFNHMIPQQINQQVSQPIQHQMYQYPQQKVVMNNRMNPPPVPPIKVQPESVIMSDTMSHHQMHNIPQSPLNNINNIQQNQMVKQPIVNKSINTPTTPNLNQSVVQTVINQQSVQQSLVQVKSKENEKENLIEKECLWSKEIQFLINLPLSVEEEEILCDYDR